ncbi:MAG: hypothetical protein PUB18_00950 [bacterium]|nr:hypothetical protein [bacterium]
MFKTTKNKEAMKSTCIRLKRETAEDVQELAEKTHRKPTELIRVIVENYFNSLKQIK